MAKFHIQIDSILGGISQNAYQGRRNEFHSSIGIDPDRRIFTSGVAKTSGVLMPSSATDFTSTGLSGYPVWFITNPENVLLYVYASDGELISYSGFASETVIGVPTSGAGNGAAYYNNYIYLATPTNISRYGPLDNTPVLTNTVWTGTTLGSQTALGNPTYPDFRGVSLPNHPMHVHADNKLYVGDFETADNANEGRGKIHWIRTEQATDPGDTNLGTTQNAFYLPPSYAPIDIESWGMDLVIAAVSLSAATGDDASTRRGNAKLFFWDAINAPALPYKAVQLPDPIVSALLNHNGRLFIWSGSYGSGLSGDGAGVRLSEFLGGYSVRQLAFIEEGAPPIAGGVAAQGDRVVWGGFTTYPEDSICMYAYGYKNGNIPAAIHNIASSTATPAQTIFTATAVGAVEQAGFGADPRWIMGWKDGAATQDFGIDRINVDFATSRTSVWRSQIYQLPSPFRINKISLPLGRAVGASMTLIPTVFIDDLSASTALTTINNTNYANSERRIVYYPSVHGTNNFCLQLRWTGTATLPVNLPIVIEGETKADATQG